MLTKHAREPENLVFIYFSTSSKARCTIQMAFKYKAGRKKACFILKIKSQDPDSAHSAFGNESTTGAKPLTTGHSA